jgi:pyridoxine 5-phosphate synthase
MKQLGCRVSLFMDAEALADGDAAPVVRALNADRVELYTEPYARAFHAGGEELRRSLDLYARAARNAAAQGLGVNAGHDLSCENLPAFLQHVPGVAEVSIGHALIADALEFGLPATVGRYLAAIRG